MEFTLLKDQLRVWECRMLYKKYFRKGFRDLKYTKMYFAAIDDGKVIGCMGLNEPENGLIRFTHLIVHPDYRGNGIGPDILRRCIEYLKTKKGVKLIRNHKSTKILFSNIFTELGFVRNKSLQDNNFEFHVGE